MFKWLCLVKISAHCGENPGENSKWCILWPVARFGYYIAANETSSVCPFSVILKRQTGKVGNNDAKCIFMVHRCLSGAL